MNFVFDQTGDWEAVKAAEAWCEENGISVGTMQSGSPRGIKRGKHSISKWRNLTNEDKKLLDGMMTGDMRNGPVQIQLNDGFSEVVETPA